jgi:2-(1,2-epoxy-1,2-dihydrophenyl)acetyl-CoA isomerase
MSSNGTLGAIEHHDDAGVRVITLNRPERKNALDIPMRASLTAVVEDAHGDPGIHAVVVTGAGGTF